MLQDTEMGTQRLMRSEGDAAIGGATCWILVFSRQRRPVGGLAMSVLTQFSNAASEVDGIGFRLELTGTRHACVCKKSGS